jgi:hypothetical protein
MGRVMAMPIHSVDRIESALQIERSKHRIADGGMMVVAVGTCPLRMHATNEHNGTATNTHAAHGKISPNRLLREELL